MIGRVILGHKKEHILFRSQKTARDVSYDQYYQLYVPHPHVLMQHLMLHVDNINTHFH